MQDEQFMRQWNAVHEDFTADLHQTLNQFGRDRRKSLGLIDPAYGRPALSPAAQASLRGLAASVLTFALWLSVLALASAGLTGTAELAAAAPAAVVLA